MGFCTVNPAIFHTRHETFTPLFHHIFLGLQLQILNSMTHCQFSKWNKQYKWDKNSLDKKNIDFRGCECYALCERWLDWRYLKKEWTELDVLKVSNNLIMHWSSFWRSILSRSTPCIKSQTCLSAHPKKDVLITETINYVK